MANMNQSNNPQQQSGKQTYSPGQDFSGKNASNKQRADAQRPQRDEDPSEGEPRGNRTRN